MWCDEGEKRKKEERVRALRLAGPSTTAHKIVHRRQRLLSGAEHQRAAQGASSEPEGWGRLGAGVDFTKTSQKSHAVCTGMSRP